MRSILVVLIICVQSALYAADPLPRSTPEAEGIPSAAVLDFVDAADRHVDGEYNVAFGETKWPPLTGHAN